MLGSFTVQAPPLAAHLPEAHHPGIVTLSSSSSVPQPSPQLPPPSGPPRAAVWWGRLSAPLSWWIHGLELGGQNNGYFGLELEIDNRSDQRTVIRKEFRESRAFGVELEIC